MAGPRQLDIALDPTTGDLDLSSGGLVLTDDLAQAATTSLRCLLGEWFLDRTDGLPWLQSMLGHGASQARTRAEIRTALLATPGIRSVESMTLTLDRVTRVLTVTFRANGEPRLITVGAGL